MDEGFNKTYNLLYSFSEYDFPTLTNNNIKKLDI